MIMFTRAAAISSDTLMLSAVLDNSNDESPYEPGARIFQYDRLNPEGDQWSHRDFYLSIQSIAVNEDLDVSPERQRLFSLLGAEGDVYHFSLPDHHQEIIEGAGTTHSGAKFYGHMLSMRQIGARLYACGTGGQIYVRHGRDDWRMLTDAVLYDPDAKRRMRELNPAPPSTDPGYAEFIINRALNPPSRDIIFFDIAGLSEDAIYLCGVVGPGSKPVLCYWDGETLEELKIPLEEAALTGIYIENPDSVWICGREGVLLHGSRARGFNPVPGNRRLNLFHGITPYRGKLVMPASVRPGGLWEFDPETGAFGHFSPRLPPMTPSPPELYEPQGAGIFYAEAVGDVLWVVASRDIYRFDGKEWERIPHPDMP